MIGIEGILLCILGFGAYYAGIVIRRVALPGKGAPRLGKQLLLGIPISLVVVSTLLLSMNFAVLQTTSNLLSALITLGIIMEHGMMLNESLSKHLESIQLRRTGT